MKNAIKREPCKLVCRWPSVSILCNKQTIITALLALVALVGQAQENNYTISGNLDMLINEGVKIYDVEIDNDSTKIVPAGEQRKRYEVKDGNFLISGRVEKPLYSQLMVRQDMKTKNGETRVVYHPIPFILEAGNIVMDSEQLLFRGTPLNDACFEAMLKYRELIDSDQYDELKSYVKDFVKQHRADPAAVMMIDLASELLQPYELLTLIDQCSEDVQRSFNIALLKYRLIEEYKGPQEGEKFVDFAVEYNGKTTHLSDYVGRGKYVLVDFWASWCGPCRQEIPNIIAAYEKYKGKGLEVVGIAVSDKPEATLRAIEHDKIPYPQIINSQEIATYAYGITGIPEIILFAPDGTILFRGLRGNEIVKKLAEIFDMQ